MTGFFCWTLAVIITIFVLMTGNYNDAMLKIGIMYTDKSYEISFLVLSLIIYSLGILSGVLLILNTIFETSSRYSKLRKQYDKNSVASDNSAEKIKILENKIETLEVALKNALDK